MPERHSILFSLVNKAGLIKYEDLMDLAWPAGFTHHEFDMVMDDLVQSTYVTETHGREYIWYSID